MTAFAAAAQERDRRLLFGVGENLMLMKASAAVLPDVEWRGADRSPPTWPCAGRSAEVGGDTERSAKLMEPSHLEEPASAPGVAPVGLAPGCDASA